MSQKRLDKRNSVQPESELLKELKSASPRSIGNYILGKTLGEGTFGKVKLATHKLIGENVAVKIVDKLHAPVVAREIETWKRLRHPNIVQLFEVLTSETKIYMVMEYVSGGEIFHFIEENGPVSEKEGRKLFKQLLKAMKYCHDKKFLENILLDQHSNIKLIDFGFTTEYESKTKLLDTYCGSTAYAAPEMIAGQKYSGPEVDIWSLGVILYTMICGYLPFDDDNEARVHSKILALDYEFPEHVSEPAQDLIKRILKLKPSDRISIEQMLVHPWFRLEHASTQSLNTLLSNLSTNNLQSAPNITVTAETLTSSLPGLKIEQRQSLLRPPQTPNRSSSQTLLVDFLAQRSVEEKLVLYHLALLGFDTHSMIRAIQSDLVDPLCGIFYLLVAKLQNSQSLATASLLSLLSSTLFHPVDVSDQQITICVDEDFDWRQEELSPSLQQTINDRMFGLLYLSNQTFEGSRSSSFQFTIPKMEFGFNREPNDGNPELRQNYYSFLSLIAQKSSKCLGAQDDIKRNFNHLSPGLVSPGSPALFASSPSLTPTMEVPSAFSPTRRSSAPEIDPKDVKSIPGSLVSSRRSNAAKLGNAPEEKEPADNLLEVREFRDRRNSRKQATISEEEEA